MFLTSSICQIQTPSGTEWVQTSAASSEADYLVHLAGKNWQNMARSVSFENRIDRLIDGLLDVYIACHDPNWDGYGAEPISSQTVENAERLLRKLPNNLPDPDFGAEADGHLTMEWYKTPERVVSLSVSQDGMLHYAALLGQVVRQNGTELLGATFPEPIAGLIRRVMGNG